ncbi:MAG: hypothetical protein JWP58_2955, partial [Hymenobacter sp.]|nr:hypothetical protein [Hymenobacter sp.]
MKFSQAKDVAGRANVAPRADTSGRGALFVPMS